MRRAEAEQALRTLAMIGATDGDDQNRDKLDAVPLSKQERYEHLGLAHVRPVGSTEITNVLRLLDLCRR